MERLSSLIDWQPVGALPAPPYLSARGEAAWPPLAVWHDLSDVRLAEALEDRASFRGFAAHEPTPGRTALARSRARQSPAPLHRNRLQPQAKPRPPTGVTAAPGARVAHLAGRQAERIPQIKAP